MHHQRHRHSLGSLETRQAICRQLYYVCPTHSCTHSCTQTQVSRMCSDTQSYWNAEHFLDADRSNSGLLHRDALKQALCARGLALSSRSAPINHVCQLCLLNLLAKSIALLELLFEQTLPEVCASQTLHYRQLQLALANSDEDPEGLIDYRSVAPHLSKLLLKSQASCLRLPLAC